MPKNLGSIFYKIPPYKPLLITYSLLTEKNIFINIQISEKNKNYTFDLLPQTY